MVETAEGHYNNQIMIETLTKFKQTKLQRLESYLSSVLQYTSVKPSTASAPKTPSMAQRPWMSSQSLNLCNQKTSL